MPLLLIGRYHACLSHSGNPTNTRTQQQLVRQCLAQNRITPKGPATSTGICRRGPPARLLRRFAPGVVLQHRRDLRRQQGHEVAHKIQLGVVKAPVLADRQYRPAVQKSRRPPDPYQELQDILLRSYGLSASQRTSKWPDHPGCGNNRPSVMWDRLTALQPATVKEIQTVLFLRKLPRYIRDLINPREFQEPETLI
jgi:hypothetical protein